MPDYCRSREVSNNGERLGCGIEINVDLELWGFRTVFERRGDCGGHLPKVPSALCKYCNDRLLTLSWLPAEGWASLWCTEDKCRLKQRVRKRSVWKQRKWCQHLKAVFVVRRYPIVVLSTIVSRDNLVENRTSNLNPTVFLSLSLRTLNLSTKCDFYQKMWFLGIGSFPEVLILVFLQK